MGWRLIMHSDDDDCIFTVPQSQREEIWRHCEDSEFCKFPFWITQSTALLKIKVTIILLGLHAHKKMVSHHKGETHDVIKCAWEQDVEIKYLDLRQEKQADRTAEKKDEV